MILKFKKKYLIGISIAILLLILDFMYFLKTRWFYSFLILAISLGWLQFWIDFFNEIKRQKEIEVKFLEFVRSLVNTVKSGISIPQAIVNAAGDDYGALNVYIKKLSNQVQWGIPVPNALLTFSKDTGNVVIKRSVAIVIEAEKFGGDIEEVLQSVVNSVFDVKKMKQERKSTAYSQIMQGYIIFFVFIIIMLVLQLKLFPQLMNMGSSFGGIGGLGFGEDIISGEAGKLDLDKIFFGLVVVQGFFAGIMVGKFSEGTLKNGIIHSLALITIATLMITTIKGGLW